jgi:hypothetical protein
MLLDQRSDARLTRVAIDAFLKKEGVRSFGCNTTSNENAKLKKAHNFYE